MSTERGIEAVIDEIRRKRRGRICELDGRHLWEEPAPDGSQQCSRCLLVVQVANLPET